jgi:SAM-dependent methyltransferase
MTLAHEISSYFSTPQSSAGLSEAATYHYDEKRRYLTDESLVASTWHNSTYLLSRRGFSISNKKVLDLGAGTGFLSIYFAAAGASKVVALKPRLTKVDAMKRFIEHLPETVAEKIVPDTRRLDEFGSEEKFDLIFAQEVISHINDDQLLDRLHSLLEPGGILYITDFNNELYAPYRKEMNHHWEHFEKGPAGKAGHHTVELPYEQYRNELITKWHPDISEADAEKFAESSAYMWGDDLKDAATRYIDDNILPESQYQQGTPPVQPVHGYLMEKQFNALKMKPELKKLGFQSVQIFNTVGFDRPSWMKFILRRIPVAIKLRLRPGFIIMATNSGQ